MLLYVFAISCKKETVCIEKKYITGKAGFYYTQNDSLQDTSMAYAITLTDTLGVIYPNSKNVRLHFNSTQNFTNTFLILDTNNFQLADTLTLFYTRNLHYISSSCGYNYFYEIDSVQHTSNSIDSIAIGNKIIDNDVNKEHIKIIF